MCSKNFSKNILVINCDLHASSRKAAVWDDPFTSCGNGLAPVLEILMNNNIVSPFFFGRTTKAYIILFRMKKIQLFVEYFALKVSMC